MTNAAIAKRQAVENIKHDTARTINDLIEGAVKQSGLKGEDADTLVSEILDLVTEDDS